MVDDHEDYESGAAPAAHKVSHQDGGTDEISVAGLTGITNGLAAHALIATAHQDAPDLIETHRLVAAAHHAKYTDAEAEAIADVQIGIHAALPTVHQDAPDLILTHKGDAAAHHAKYTDAEAEAIADVQIGIHAALPTVHQDAPDLILTHKGDAAAHHAKYTDLEAEAIADVQIGIHAALPTVHQDAPTLIDDHRLVPGAHHAKYTDANARAAIGNIFGADGKADADIDLDGHKIGAEGTWAPVFIPSTSGSITLNGSFNTGFYLRIGRVVTISGFFRVASVSSPVGWLTIAGLPFTCGTGYQYCASVALEWENLDNNVQTPIVAAVWQGTTTIRTAKIVNGARAAMAADIKAGTDITVNASYISV